jgi:hypothetical protein
MSERPRPPEDLPVGNGHSGPAAAASPPADDRPGALAAILANRWAVILRRFRDYMHQQ